MRRIYLACICAMTLLMATTTAAPRKPSRWDKARFAEGTEAPDFELPILKLKTNDAGEHTGSITEEKVTLKKLMNEKKVVLLFMSSYT